ncbi:tape measure protein [Sorangium sp. So ce134]
MKELTLSQRALRRVLQEVSSFGSGRGLVAINALVDGYERVAPVIDRVRNAASAAMPAVRALGSAAIFAGGAAATLAAGGAVGAGLFGSAVVKAQAEREGLMKGLEIQLKSAEAGQQAMLLATRTADLIGESRAATVGQFNDLLAKGFTVQKVDELVKRMADMKVVDPKADMAGITRAIGQIAGTGRLQGDELNQLAENGLETGAVYDALAKRLGKTRTEIIKLKEAGKIDSDTAIQGIMDAIANQTGGKAAGVVANEKSQGLGGILKRFENLPGNMLFSIGVNRELDTLKATMNSLLSYFETTGAGKVADALESTFGALVKGFAGIDVNQAGGITNTIDLILAGIVEARPQIESFARGVRQAFEIGGAIIRVVGWFSQMGESADRLVARVGPIGTAIRDGISGPFKAVPDLVMGAVSAINTLSSIGLGGWVANIQAEIGALAMSVYTWASDIGTQIVAGIEAGVLGAYSRAIDAVSNVAWGAISAAKTILGIKSPSKVFEEIGAFTAMGFERGIAANDTGALSALVAPPDLAAIAGGAAAVAGRATGGGGFSVGDIYVDARGAQEPQRVAELVREEVVRTLESFALSSGAAA